jgi:hypothetical protein
MRINIVAELLVEVEFGVADGLGVGVAVLVLGAGVAVGAAVGAGGGWTATCVVAWDVTNPVFVAVAVMVQVVVFVKLGAVKFAT